MKKLIYILIAGMAGLAACKKTDIKTSPLASLNVTNVVVGGAPLTLNTSAQTVFNNSYAQFSLNAGSSAVKLYDAANPATPYYDQAITTKNGEYYSLFLGGTSPAAVDAVLVKESYKNYTDSLCGVRFVNMSPGSSPISVNLQGQANGSEAGSVAYKAFTDFKQYPAKKVNTSYVFEIRDATSGNLITTYTLPTPYFHNVAIVLHGLVGGVPAAGITLTKYY